MHIFYCPEACGAVEGSSYMLNQEESHHLSKVLRLNIGDTIQIIDGCGKMYDASISLVSKNNCNVVITKVLEGLYTRPYYNHVAIAPTKNIDRIEFFLEKAVEFGVDEITFLLTEHSERKVIKMDRLEKIVISAVKQSGNLIMPKLNDLTSFDEFVEKAKADYKLIAHCEEGKEKIFFCNAIEKNSKVLTLIGPEGDFSTKEIEKALNLDYKAVSLGNTRLRTETAGISVCAFLSAKNLIE